MVEVFRRPVVKLLVDRKLLNDEFAENLLSWRHSGFSIDNSVRILDATAQENLAEYISRPPISLKKIRYEPFKGRVLFHTTYSEYFKENMHIFDALDFLAELTQHIPPMRLQLIRRYGLYASRTKGRWDRMPYVAERAPAAWKASRPALPPRQRQSQLFVSAHVRGSSFAALASSATAESACPIAGPQDNSSYQLKARICL